MPSPEAPFGFEFFDAGWKSMLPSYLAYKWADALIATVMAAGPQVGDFGKIHRPASSRADHFIPASGARYQIDATRPAFTIVGTAAVGGSGERVEKVGASTGWTYGYVEEPCYDSHFRTQTSSGSFLTRTTRCIVKNSAPAYRGDSGGPYFRIVGNPADSRVELLGTSQGGTPMVYSTFSPLNNIAMELGPLTYFP